MTILLTRMTRAGVADIIAARVAEVNACVVVRKRMKKNRCRHRERGRRSAARRDDKQLCVIAVKRLIREGRGLQDIPLGTLWLPIRCWDSTEFQTIPEEAGLADEDPYVQWSRPIAVLGF